MNVRRVIALGLIVMFGMVAGRTAVRAQQAAPAKDAIAEADEKILAEIHDHNEIMSNLEYLSDVIGARLTGTENLKKANDWTRQKFADYGRRESAPGTLDHRAYLDARGRNRANRQPVSASADHRVLRLGALHKRCCARACGLRHRALPG